MPCKCFPTSIHEKKKKKQERDSHFIPVILFFSVIRKLSHTPTKELRGTRRPGGARASPRLSSGPAGGAPSGERAQRRAGTQTEPGAPRNNRGATGLRPRAALTRVLPAHGLLQLLHLLLHREGQLPQLAEEGAGHGHGSERGAEAAGPGQAARAAGAFKLPPARAPLAPPRPRPPPPLARAAPRPPAAILAPPRGAQLPRAGELGREGTWGGGAPAEPLLNRAGEWDTGVHLHRGNRVGWLLLAAVPVCAVLEVLR